MVLVFEGASHTKVVVMEYECYTFFHYLHIIIKLDSTAIHITYYKEIF